MTASIGRILSIVFDCPDLDAESEFWQAVLGYRVHHRDSHWVTLVDPADSAQRMSFQQVVDHRPPTWPENERPQQAHLDVLVADLEAADARALALGAVKISDLVSHDDERFWVYADPAGHPFCLIQQYQNSASQQ